MCQRCVAMQARCDRIADWLTERNLLEVCDEDAHLLTYLISKSVPHFGIPMLTPNDLGGIVASAYFTGYKKGYEVKGLEKLSDVQSKG